MTNDLQVDHEAQAKAAAKEKAKAEAKAAAKAKAKEKRHSASAIRSHRHGHVGIAASLRRSFSTSRAPETVRRTDAPSPESIFSGRKALKRAQTARENLREEASLLDGGGVGVFDGTLYPTHFSQREAHQVTD